MTSCINKRQFQNINVGTHQNKVVIETIVKNLDEKVKKIIEEQDQRLAEQNREKERLFRKIIKDSEDDENKSRDKHREDQDKVIDRASTLIQPVLLKVEEPAAESGTEQ